MNANNTNNNLNIRLTDRDILMLKIISKSGSATFKFLSEELGYKKTRMDQLAKAGFIEENNDPTKGGKRGKKLINRYSYSLATKGVDYCKMNRFITAHGGHNGHDHAHITCKFVYNLLDKEQIDIQSIKNEKELELIYKKEIAASRRKKLKFSVCDLAVVKDDETTIYEVETANYRAEHRLKHKNFASKVANISKDNYKIIK